MSAKAIRWFDESPDVGHPRCLCSWCEERIEDPELLPGADPEGVDWVNAEPVRLWTSDRKLEARFHDRCYDEALAAGAMTLRMSLEGRRAE